MRKFWFALVISLLLHLSQYELVTSLFETALSQNESEFTTIEIIEDPVIDENSTPQKQVVKTFQEKEPTDLSKPADFLAEKNNRTKEETRAKNFGVFQQEQAGSVRPLETENALNQNSSDEEITETKKTLDGDFFKQNFHQPSRLQGFSQSEYELPRQIQTGSVTNLNTDADIHASFYNRVTDLVYIRWVQRIRSVWNQTPESTKFQMRGRAWTTEIEIHLNHLGEFKEGFVMKKSGFQPFDRAAVFAFENARFFPNPPKAKVDPDGIIRLKYRIAVHISSY